MHTPAPWEVCGGYTPKYTSIIAGNQYIVFGMADYEDHQENGKHINAPSFDQQRENVKRIVDCVNACEGINPEAIPLIISTLKALAYSGMDELYWLIPPQAHGPENTREKARQIAELLAELCKKAGVFRPSTEAAK